MTDWRVQPVVTVGLATGSSEVAVTRIQQQNKTHPPMFVGGRPVPIASYTQSWTLYLSCLVWVDGGVHSLVEAIMDLHYNHPDKSFPYVTLDGVAKAMLDYDTISPLDAYTGAYATYNLSAILLHPIPHLDIDDEVWEIDTDSGWSPPYEMNIRPINNPDITTLRPWSRRR